MSEKKDENGLLMDHNYDGIQEYNHPAPFWWQLFFYLSIAFSVSYYIYYEIGPGETSSHRLQEQLVEIERIKNAQPKIGPDNEKLMAMLKDPSVVKAGKEVFASKCAACHGPEGGGVIGPNLTDQYWLNGKGSAADIFSVVREGVPDKGMPSWGPLLSPTELTSVAVFIRSIKGSHPSNPKAPQGEEVKDN